MKYITIMFFMLIGINLYAQQEVQEIKGKVVFISSRGEVPLAGAFVHWSGKSSGVFTNNKGQFIIKNGDRIAQIVIAKHERAIWEECNDLSKTERGSGGFGSTGQR